jgi:hypothetical protein|eukprot:COSAG01_NODE_2988_length_6750_cov_2.101338_6_plen_196_part_00
MGMLKRVLAASADAADKGAGVATFKLIQAAGWTPDLEAYLSLVQCAVGAWHSAFSTAIRLTQSVMVCGRGQRPQSGYESAGPNGRCSRHAASPGIRQCTGPVSGPRGQRQGSTPVQVTAVQGFGANHENILRTTRFGHTFALLAHYYWYQQTASITRTDCSSDSARSAGDVQLCMVRSNRVPCALTCRGLTDAGV